MFKKPKNSPWGEIDFFETLCPGVFMVIAPGRGGTMVSKDMAAVLSPAARKCGFKYGGYICFDEDSQEDIVFRELLDKKLWAIPDRIKDKAAYEENINNTLREHHPDYWRARRRGIEQARPAPVPVQKDR